MSHELIGTLIGAGGIIISLLSALIAKISSQATRITVLENNVKHILDDKNDERKILEAIRDSLYVLNTQVSTLTETMKLQIDVIQKELASVSSRVSKLEHR